MTIIAAAYDSPTRYALACDSHSMVNGLRIPSVKASGAGAVLVGAAGAQVESACGRAWLCGPGLDLAQRDIRGALAAMRVHVLAHTERAKDCPGLDSHFLAVGPEGVFILGSDGGVMKAPDRWAIGCGEDIGIGAMYARDGHPEAIVRTAVEAACALREGCFGSAVVLRSGGA